MRTIRIAILPLLALSSAVFAQTIPPAVKSAEASVNAEKIRAHVKFLSDDLLEGRAPGTRGGEIAAQYIATQFALYGLKPGGDNGTYLQQVNFVGTKTLGDKTHFSLVPKRPEGGMGIMLYSYDLKFGDDYTVNNRTLTPSVDINAPIVFVGYGVVAPEFGWNDYAGVDVKGKVVLCIVGDPPSDDPKFFGGKALTYYGRWTYKFEEAARQGAVGALIIHRTDLASYGWDVVKNSNTGEKTYLRDNKDPQLAAASWIQLDVARQLFKAANLDLDTEMTAAGKRGFKAAELPVRLEAHIESTVRNFQSPNVIGILPGANVAEHKPDQAVLYTAHYDHLGMVPGKEGDNIYNGAADNATGCGMLLEMARAWASSGIHPPHSMIFAAVAAEEQGLLGSEYLGQHPPVPAGQIALDINYDMILPLGIPRQVSVNGAQRTTFNSAVEATAKRFDLAIVPDAHPEAGTYYRSDHFSLSRVGIPAFSIDQGELFEGHDLAWGEAKSKDFVDHDYHNFSDNYHPEWDFAGNAKLVRFGMELGWQAVSAPKPIEWLKGDEFEAARKASEK
ncbi:M28 family metallopeptidase [Edaphobacter albus]|uniref:M28 family metallopeptidase n=1 Tax=Edaphobacter sp. 4G125 TaxID=2763071 RepID=UPI00210669AA|nr:M28 family metallopeptidase [Edaphobacter sp. 4G125]